MDTKNKKQSTLSDCYKKTGTDFNSFKNEITSQEMRTQFLKNVKLGDISVCCLHKERTKNAEVEEDGKKYIYFTYLKPGKVWNEEHFNSKNGFYTITSEAKLLEEKWNLIPEDVRKEVEDIGFFLYIKGAGFYKEIKDSYNVSLKVADMENETFSINERTIFLVSGNIGNGIWKNLLPNMDNCIEKFLVLAKNLEMNATSKVGIVFRKENNIKKIMAFTGANYPYENFPLTTIIGIAEKLKQEMKKLGYGEPIYSWEVQQSKCILRMYYRQFGKEMQKKYMLPDEFLPCIELANSDTCQSALSSRKLIWYKKEDSYIELKNLEYSREHKDLKGETSPSEDVGTGIINVDEFVKEDLKRIAQYEKFYQKLKTGLFVMVTAPDNELSSFTEMNKNRKSYETLLRTTMQNTGVSKILGMKRKKEILDKFRLEFNEQKVFTEYDIYKDLMKIPKIAGLNEPHARDLRVAAGSF